MANSEVSRLKFNDTTYEIADELARESVGTALAEVASVEAKADAYNTALSGRITNLENSAGAVLVAKTRTAMTDTNKIYVYTGTTTTASGVTYTKGHWYYHNGSKWTDGGEYNQNLDAIDATLTQSNKGADAKVTGDRLTAAETEISNLKSAIGANVFSKNFGSASIYSNYDIQLSLTQNTNCTVYLLSLDSSKFRTCVIYASVNSNWVELDRITTVGGSKSFIIPASATALRIGPVLTEPDSNSPKWTGCVFLEHDSGQINFLMREITNIKGDLQDKVDFEELPYVTPQMYGAVGDGVTDDTAAIQAAIDSGKRVIFSQGEYIVSAPLVISKPGTILEGENNRSWGVNQQCAQLIGKAATYFDSIIQLTENAENSVIKNLYLLGQTNYNVDYGIHFESVADSFVADLIIENVVINYFTQGIHIDSTFKSLFTNVRCQNCRSYGFYIAGKLSGEYAADATTITMINCYVDQGVYGYYLNRVRYSSLINCACDHTKSACYAMQTCSGISLINCGCEATKGVVLFMQGSCHSVSIAGLEIIAPDTLTEGTEDAFISGYGMFNMTISGVTIVGGVGREYDILDKSPEYTSISVLDNSFSPERCADISNGCIKFLFRDKVYSISNSPQFAGQMAITSTGVYIADNNLQWSKVN